MAKTRTLIPPALKFEIAKGEDLVSVRRGSARIKAAEH